MYNFYRECCRDNQVLAISDKQTPQVHPRLGETFVALGGLDNDKLGPVGRTVASKTYLDRFCLPIEETEVAALHPKLFNYIKSFR